MSDKEEYKDVGTISVELHRAIQQHSIPVPLTISEPDITYKVPEKALKGRAISQQAQ